MTFSLLHSISFVLGGMILFFSASALLNKNPVHSLLFLVCMVVCMSIMSMLIGMEFISLLLITVYAGAIAVLFLFVVMMINYVDIQKRSQTSGYWQFNAIVLCFFGYIFLNALFLYVPGFTLNESGASYSSLEKLAELLYLKYGNEVINTGIILLIGVVGSVMMTINLVKKVPKRISADLQNARNTDNSVKIVDVDSGSGINY